MSTRVVADVKFIILGFPGKGNFLFFICNLVLVLLLLGGWPLLLLYLYHRQGSLEGVAQRLGLGRGFRSRPSSRALWWHGASVGEIRMLAPLVRAWRKRHPEGRLLVTTMTLTGRQTARELLPEAEISLLPFDLPLFWALFFYNFRPAGLVVAETEIWPNLWRAVKRRGLPLVLVNARLSQKSFRRYRYFGFIFTGIFRLPDLVLVQDENSGRRFARLGTPAERVVLSGNLKFDLPRPVPDGGGNVIRLPFPAATTLVVAGSTHPGEEEMLLGAWNNIARSAPSLTRDAVLVIAPRHPRRFAEVAARLGAEGVDFISYAAWLETDGDAIPDRHFRVLLLDTLGDLVHFYPLSRCAVIGGTLVPGIGGHNPLEAAVHGRPVIHGPYTFSFADGYRYLDEQGGGLPVQNTGELEMMMRRCLEDDDFVAAEGRRALATLERHRGALARTLEGLEKALS